MFELPIACGGCRARRKAGSVEARGRDATEGPRNGLSAVAGAEEYRHGRQSCLVCSPAAASVCSVAAPCARSSRS